MPETYPVSTPTGGRWPTPEAAYTLAPSITSEITWVAYTARDFGHLTSPREYWLRKAAVFDRIALTEQQRTFTVAGSATTDADATAADTARRLLAIDHAAGLGPSGYANGPYPPDHPDSTHNPRGYIRQEYALWANSQ
ncbi:hypothetical protein [Streptomyces globisporus]|uniref:hypothetical protein n=1 Tax=Streptomyces globisporus TaxID=1908 RepID=UPI0037ABF1B7